MSEKPEPAPSINGLVDSQRAAQLLGISPNTFKVWASRAKSSQGNSPLDMPEPVGKLNGKVYRVEDIIQFKQRLAARSRPEKTKIRSRGAYYTPNIAARLLAEFATEREADIILEPSFGTGIFTKTLNEIIENRNLANTSLIGFEIDEDVAKNTVKANCIQKDQVIIGDFLAQNKLPKVDAVVGNPPYVRIRELSQNEQIAAQNTTSKILGEPIGSTASVWVPFVTKAAHSLKNGGRMALVLPLDFTYVSYARKLWGYLGNNFGRIKVLRYKKRIFPEILQNVLLLFAEDKGGKTSEVLFGAHSELTTDPSSQTANRAVKISEIVEGNKSFQLALLPEEALNTIKELESFTEQSIERMKFNIGYVSGNKRYFHPDDQTQTDYNLPPNSLHPTVASSRQLARQPLHTGDMEPTSKLWLPGNILTREEQRYVQYGETEHVDTAYKCRIRNPWYRVPGVKIPDLILTTFSDVPRLHINNQQWTVSNSALGGFTRSKEDPERIIDSWYNPLTLLSAELQIHSLGGGVMIAVPKEADSIALLKSSNCRPLDRVELSRALTSNSPMDAYLIGSRSISNLVGKSGTDALLSASEELSLWRKAKG